MQPLKTMTDLPTIRVFIASPSDVRPECLIAQRVVQRLDKEFSHCFHVEAIWWENEPLVAAHHFQDPKNIPPASTADIVVVILWSRLGVPITGTIGAVSGRSPVTGTESEFEEALRSYREHGIPDLLLYRKTAEVMASLKDREQLADKIAQQELVEDFLARWFLAPASGGFMAALHDFTRTAEFEERLEAHLRALLKRRLEAIGSTVPASGIRWHQNPFRGLESFGLEHAPVFFGRTRARNELREVLVRQAERGCAFVLVIGASGSGKSSLVKAGLLPDLMLPGMVGTVAVCRYALLRPSDGRGDPLTTLATAMLGDTALPELAGLRYDVETLADQLRTSPAQVVLAVRQGLGVASDAAGLTAIAEARLTVVIDQLEELFTLKTITPEDRRTLLVALEALARSRLVWVIATMRADVFGQLADVPELAALAADEARYLLSPPDSAEISQIIRQPAREAGLRFEVDPGTNIGLDETLGMAAAGAPGSLPLLEFTLDQLWCHRDAQGVIGYAAYREMGGLEGAVGRRAEAALTAQPDTVQAALPALLRALVTVEKHTTVARAAPLTIFPTGSPQRVLIDAFLAPEARLLVADGNAHDGVRIRVAHEALLTHWPRAADRIAEDRSDLQLRARLEQAAALWASAKTDKESLLLRSGLPLSEAQDFVGRRRPELDTVLTGFVDASAAAARTAGQARLNRLRAGVAAFATLSAMAIAGAWVAWDRTIEAERRSIEAGRERDAKDAQLRETQINQSRFLAQAADTARRDSDYDKAIGLALAGMPPDPGASGQRPQVGEAVTALNAAIVLDPARAALVGHRSGIDFVSFSPDGARVVTASRDGTARVWDAGTGQSLAVLEGHEGSVTRALFTSDGARVVTASTDGTLRVWDAGTGESRAVLRQPADQEADRDDKAKADAGESEAIDLSYGVINHSSFSRDGTRAVVLYKNDTLVWGIDTGRSQPVAAGQRIESASISPDGQRVVTVSRDDTVQIWSTDTGRSLIVLQRAPDSNPRLSRRFSTHSASFSPDGTRVLITERSLLKVRDAFTGDITLTIETERPGLPEFLGNPAFFSADGTRIFRIGTRTTYVWDAKSGQAVGSFPGNSYHHDEQPFSPDGTRVIARTDHDEAAVVWDTATGQKLADIKGHKELISSYSFSLDGTRVVTGSSDGTARVWTTTNPPHRTAFQGRAKPAIAMDFNRAGTRMAISSQKTAQVWDVATGQSLATFGNDEDFRSHTSLSPDGAKILTVTQNADINGRTVHVWDTATGQSLAVFKEQADFVRLASFSPDGTRILTISSGASFGAWTVHVWDITTGQSLVTLDERTESGISASFSPDGTRILTMTGNGAVHVWDVATGQSLAAFKEHKSNIPASFSPDGKRILSKGKDGVRVWDAASGASLAILKEHSSPSFASFSPDGKRVITASSDIRIWDVATGENLATLDGYLTHSRHENQRPDALFSPDGAQMIVPWGKIAQVWDVASGHRLLTLEGHTDIIEQASFSQDGTRLLTVSDDQTLRVWDAATGRTLAIIPEYHTRDPRVWFSPDGTQVATFSPEKVPQLWHLKAMPPIEQIALYAPLLALRDLTPWERESVSLVSTQPLVSETPTPCDVLAADPDDPDGQADGVPIDQIETEKALVACRMALDAVPDQPRLRYQLGRALERVGALDEARAAYRAAAEAGYPVAWHRLLDFTHDAFFNQPGPDRWRELATMRERAYAAGALIAGWAFADDLWRAPPPYQDHAAALAWAAKAATAGSPHAHDWLADRYALGNGVDKDPVRSLFHRALAARLFNEQKLYDDADRAAARRGSLARSLPVDDVIGVGRQLLAWKPTP